MPVVRSLQCVCTPNSRRDLTPSTGSAGVDRAPLDDDLSSALDPIIRDFRDPKSPFIFHLDAFSMSETLYMVRFLVNGLLAKKDRFSALMTGASIPVFLLLIRRVFHLLRRYKELKVSIMGAVLAVVRRIPSVRARIAEEKLKAKESISRSILVNTGESHERLREKGVAVQQLIGTLEAMSKSEKRKWSGGNLTGAVYSTNAELDEVHAYALSHFGKTNLLHPDIFSCTRQMEAEVIRMTLDLFSGDAGCCGSVTMGGTESILLAVKSYRDRGRKERGITQSNIVIPSTAHAAFMKAGDYFGVEVRRASCDQSRDYEVDLASMASLIDSNTVAVVGSSPQYPHGTMDPIPARHRLPRRRMSWILPAPIPPRLSTVRF